MGDSVNHYFPSSCLTISCKEYFKQWKEKKVQWHLGVTMVYLTEWKVKPS